MKFLRLALTALLLAGLTSLLAVAQAPSVAGKWHFVLDTADGGRTVDPVFQQDGEKVTGKWDDADVKGTFTAGKLNLEFVIKSEIGPGALKIKGELANDAITGTWEFQDYNGNFKATRVQQ